MSGPTRRLRTRLLVAMVAIALGALATATLLGAGRPSGRQDKFVSLATPLTRVNNVTPVLVLTQKLETRPFGRSGVLVLVAAVLALLAAVLVAAYLARRMTRPLAAMQTTAGRIAGGDLAARVDLAAVPDDELGNLARAI